MSNHDITRHSHSEPQSRYGTDDPSGHLPQPRSNAVSSVVFDTVQQLEDRDRGRASSATVFQRNLNAARQRDLEEMEIGAETYERDLTSARDSVWQSWIEHAEMGSQLNDGEQAIYDQMQEEDNFTLSVHSTRPSPPDGEPLHETHDQPTRSITEAVNANAQRLVYTLLEGRPSQNSLTRQPGHQTVFAGIPRSSNQQEFSRAGHDGWRAPFRWAGPQFTYLQPESSSSWETLKDSLETPRDEDDAATKGMIKGKEREMSLIPDAALEKKGSKREKQQYQTEDTVLPRSKTTVIRRTRKGSEQSKAISPIPINWRPVQRAHTPSVYSNGSVFDASSPSFAKSVPHITRNLRPTEVSTGVGEPSSSDLPASATFEGEGQSAIDTAIHSWLQGIPAQPFKGAPVLQPFPIPPASPSFTATPRRRAFPVLRDNPSVPSPSRKPSKIPAPISTAPLGTRAKTKVLIDISNLPYRQRGRSSTIKNDTIPQRRQSSLLQHAIPELRRPGYLAKNSFANPPAQHAPPLLPAIQTQTQIPPRTPSPQPYSHTALGLAPPPSTLFRRPLPPSKRQHRHRHRHQKQETKSTTALPVPTHPFFSAHPSPTHRAHLSFALARLEGRVEPKTPSPLRRWAQPPHEWFGSEVEVEQRERGGGVRRPRAMRRNGGPVGGEGKEKEKEKREKEEIERLKREEEVVEREIERLVLEEMGEEGK